MGEAAGGDYRPQTRWCGASPYGEAPPPDRAPRRPQPPRANAAGTLPPRPTTPGDVLLVQLRRELQRGHWRVALRHFLMLQAYGYEVPPAERRRCLERARDCAAREWLKIESDVAAWAQCLRQARRT